LRTPVASTHRHIALGLIIGGATGIVVAVGRGLSTGRLFELGSNNLVMSMAGLAAIGLGLVLRQESAARFLARVLADSRNRSPEFLAELPARPLFFTLFGLWFGIVLGLAESAYRLYHGPAVTWRHTLWLAPVADGAFFLVVGVGVTIVARFRSGGGPFFQAALRVFLALGLSAMLILMLPTVYPLAAMVLALGLAVQATNMLAGHSYAVAAFARRSLWVAMIGAVAIAVWAFDADRVAARPRVMTPPAGARNVVLLVLDTVRAQSLSLLGYERKTTPELDRWSKNGVVFQSAMATAPWTLPSHAGMFTGRWTHELGTADILKFDGTFPTIAEVMRDHGYATAGFVGNLVFTARGTGLARGFDHYEDFKIDVGEAILSTSLGRTFVTADMFRNLVGYHELVNRKVASGIDADFLRWLDRSRGRPFFAFLNYFDAHEPYLPPASYARLFAAAPGASRGPYIHQLNQSDHADWWKLSADQVANERALYEAAIASLDHEIGTLLQQLDERGLLKNTVVILTADHGESLGEHGVFMHGNSLYLTQLHVPLWILTPDAMPAMTVSESVSLRDIPNTVIDLAHLQIDSPFPGSSLARFWRGARRVAPEDNAMLLSLFALPGGTGEHHTPLSRGNMRGIIEDPYHYILNGDGAEELYNYRQDPSEERNLAVSAMAEDRVRRFREMVSTIAR
jgi:arylsulfatase A-like enzyme